MNHRRSLLPLLPCLFIAAVRADHPTLSLEDGSPGPITTISAVTLEQGSLSVAQVNQFIFFNGLSDEELLAYSGRPDHVHSTDRVISSSLNGAYGATDDFTLGFSLPFLWRTNLREAVERRVGVKGVRTSLEPAPKHGGVSHGGGGQGNAPTRTVVENVGDSDGLGDATLYGQYRFLHDESADRHLSAITGMKLPTGDTDIRANEGYLLAAHHQAGSGSWDPLLGLAFTQGTGRWSFDANVLYLFANDGIRDSNLGDVFNYNAAVSYRLLGARGEGAAHQDGVAHEHPTTLDLILEANGDFREEVVENDLVDPNTGGNLVFLSGGARLAWGHSWAATLSVGAPVLEDLNGIQSEPVMRLLFGVSKAF